MNEGLLRIKEIIAGTSFEKSLYVVGGAVRDELLGKIPTDFDLVTTENAIDLVKLLVDSGITETPAVVFERFGTAMVIVQGTKFEFVTARSEIYDGVTRKPSVLAASLEDDAFRRDFTVNALMNRLSDGTLLDITGFGLKDLETETLRTPREPSLTFYEDPLRMLRAVRFRWKLGFMPVNGLYEAIRENSNRLQTISVERIRDEFCQILMGPNPDEALKDLKSLDLLKEFVPELLDLESVDQGSYHHLDVWEHTLLALKNLKSGPMARDLITLIATLFHDIAKPQTRTGEGEKVHFYTHEVKGAAMTAEIMTRMKFSNKEIEEVCLLVKSHMRLGTMPTFTPAAARRLIRDIDQSLPRLFALVKADSRALRPGVKSLDVDSIESIVSEQKKSTPPSSLSSPLTGEEIIEFLKIPAGPKIGNIKKQLTEQVIEGHFEISDKSAAYQFIKKFAKK